MSSGEQHTETTKSSEDSGFWLKNLGVIFSGLPTDNDKSLTWQAPKEGTDRLPPVSATSEESRSEIPASLGRHVFMESSIPSPGAFILKVPLSGSLSRGISTELPYEGQERPFKIVFSSHTQYSWLPSLSSLPSPRSGKLQEPFHQASLGSEGTFPPPPAPPTPVMSHLARDADC